MGVAMGRGCDASRHHSALGLAALMSFSLSSGAAPLVSPAAGSDVVLAMRSDVQADLRRWWPSIVPLHPQIVDELAQSGRVPEELWVKQMVHAGKSFETTHWSLIHAEWVEGAKYPLPPGLAAVPTESRGAFPQVFSTLSAAVADKRQPPPENVYR